MNFETIQRGHSFEKTVIRVRKGQKVIFEGTLQDWWNRNSDD